MSSACQIYKDFIKQKSHSLSFFNSGLCVGELAVSLNRMSFPPDSPPAAPLQTVQSFIVGMMWSLVMMMIKNEKK